MRETRGLAPDHPDPGTAVATRRHLLDASVVEPHGGAALVLGVDLGELRPGPERDTERPLDQVVVDHTSQPTK